MTERVSPDLVGMEAQFLQPAPALGTRRPDPTGCYYSRSALDPRPFSPPLPWLALELRAYSLLLPGRRWTPILQSALGRDCVPEPRSFSLLLPGRCQTQILQPATYHGQRWAQILQSATYHG